MFLPRATYYYSVRSAYIFYGIYTFMLASTLFIKRLPVASSLPARDSMLVIHTDSLGKGGRRLLWLLFVTGPFGFLIGQCRILIGWRTLMGYTRLAPPSVSWVGSDRNFKRLFSPLTT